MPNPTAHADDMKSPAQHETMPSLWWLFPWQHVQRLAKDVAFLKWNVRDEYERRVLAIAEAAKAKADRTAEITDHNITASKLDEAKHLLTRAKADRNDFLRQVEVTLKPACPHLYEDTIGYVQWAADEIKGLRACLSVMTEDRDAYVEKLEKARAECDKAGDDISKFADKCFGLEVEIKTLQDKVNDLEAKWPRDLWHGGKIYGNVYTHRELPEGGEVKTYTYNPEAHKELIEKHAKPKRNLEKENASLRERLADAKQGIKNLRLDAKRTRKGLLMEQRENMKLRARLRNSPAKPAKKKVNLRTASVDDIVKAMSNKPAKKKGGRK